MIELCGLPAQCLALSHSLSYSVPTTTLRWVFLSPFSTGKSGFQKLSNLLAGT
jgi:hypothetical protein